MRRAAPPAWRRHFALRKQIRLRNFFPSLSDMLLLNRSQAGKDEDFQRFLAVRYMLQRTRGVTNTAGGTGHYSKWLAKTTSQRERPFPHKSRTHWGITGFIHGASSGKYVCVFWTFHLTDLRKDLARFCPVWTLNTLWWQLKLCVKQHFQQGKIPRICNVGSPGKNKPPRTGFLKGARNPL